MHVLHHLSAPFHHLIISPTRVYKETCNQITNTQTQLVYFFATAHEEGKQTYKSSIHIIFRTHYNSHHIKSYILGVSVEPGDGGRKVLELVTDLGS